MKKKKDYTTLILVLMLLVGLSLLLYPAFSDYWNSFHQSQAITDYVENIETLEKEDYTKYWEDAIKYNEKLINQQKFVLTPEEKIQYESLLNLSSVGVMGYVEVPKIKTTLPIYHGTDENVLQVAIGHIEWTSLPTGGESTHCVLSGHRGLPSAKLFSDLDKLEEGDLFMLRVLDEVLTYQVDQILIVEPHVVDSLMIEEGKDFVTLVTCTPYGVNSHRLLVRGYRVDNIEESKKIHVTSDAIEIEPLIVASIIACPIFLILLMIVMLPKRK